MDTALVVMFGLCAVVTGWTSDGYQRYWPWPIRLVAVAAGVGTSVLGWFLLLAAITGGVTIEWPR